MPETPSAPAAAEHSYNVPELRRLAGHLESESGRLGEQIEHRQLSPGEEPMTAQHEGTPDLSTADAFAELAFQLSGQRTSPLRYWRVREVPSGWLIRSGGSHTVADQLANVGPLMESPTFFPQDFERLAGLVAVGTTGVTPGDHQRDARPVRSQQPTPPPSEADLDTTNCVQVDRIGWPFLFRLSAGGPGDHDEIWSVPDHAWKPTGLLTLIQNQNPTPLRPLSSCQAQATLQNLLTLPRTIPDDWPEEHFYLAWDGDILLAGLRLTIGENGHSEWRRYWTGQDGTDVVQQAEVDELRQQADEVEEVSYNRYAGADLRSHGDQPEVAATPPRRQPRWPSVVQIVCGIAMAITMAWGMFTRHQEMSHTLWLYNVGMACCGVALTVFGVIGLRLQARNARQRAGRPSDRADLLPEPIEASSTRPPGPSRTSGQ